MKCQECDHPLNESEIAEVNVIAQHCTPDLTCTKCLRKYRHLTHNNMLNTIIEQKHYGKIDINNTEPDVVIITMASRDPEQGNPTSEIIFIERDKVPALITALENSLQ